MSNTQDPIKLLDEYAEARHIHGDHTYNAVTKAARDRAIAALQSPAPQPPGFDAHDMATAAADGFRDGWQAAQASEPSFIYTGQTPSELAEAFDGYTRGTAFYTQAAPARAVEPLTELLAAAESVCATLEHPSNSVNAMQMWRLRAALHGIGIPATTPTQAAQESDK